jgi:hypothetical protein
MIKQRRDRCAAALGIERFADCLDDSIVDREEPIVTSGHK